MINHKKAILSIHLGGDIQRVLNYISLSFALAVYLHGGLEYSIKKKKWIPFKQIIGTFPGQHERWKWLASWIKCKNQPETILPEVTHKDIGVKSIELGRLEEANTMEWNLCPVGGAMLALLLSLCGLSILIKTCWIKKKNNNNISLYLILFIYKKPPQIHKLKNVFHLHMPVNKKKTVWINSLFLNMLLSVLNTLCHFYSNTNMITPNYIFSSLPYFRVNLPVFNKTRHNGSLFLDPASFSVIWLNYTSNTSAFFLFFCYIIFKDPFSFENIWFVHWCELENEFFVLF